MVFCKSLSLMQLLTNAQIKKELSTISFFKSFFKQINLLTFIMFHNYLLINI